MSDMKKEMAFGERSGGGGRGGGRGGAGREDRGGGDMDRGGGRGFGRRKVCRYCADRNLKVDYKNAADLQFSVTEVRLTRKVGEQNKLFGSVTSKDVHEQLVSQGYQIERKQVHLPDPLKEVGTHEVEVKLHPEVVAKVKVTIAPEA